MGIQFNADEIFEMAIKSERNAVKMYGDLAKKHEFPEIRDEMLKLAQMEADHANAFVELRRELPEDMRNTVFDPDNEASMYLKAVADASIDEGSPKIAEKMSGQESLEEILKTAIELEKQTILFYLGIKDMVAERLGKDKVDKIIKEEQGHVVTLTNKLEELK